MSSTKPKGPPMSSEISLKMALEAILMVAEEPVAELSLASVLQVPTAEVSTTLEALAAEFSAQGRGFELRQVAGGWRIYTHPEAHEVVERFLTDGATARLTQAALETLAVVAYRQPISRGRISAIRGVNVDAVMRTLVTRGLVEESGIEHETQAILYRTTSYFLERLGLTSIEELPELAGFLPDIDGLDEVLDSLSS